MTMSRKTRRIGMRLAGIACAGLAILAGIALVSSIVATIASGGAGLFGIGFAFVALSFFATAATSCFQAAKRLSDEPAATPPSKALSNGGSAPRTQSSAENKQDSAEYLEDDEDEDEYTPEPSPSA